LVRDKIPEEIRWRGEDVAEVALDKEAIILALRRKLIEEAFEVYDAITTQRLIEELADLKEVMNALARRLEIDVREIDRAARKKVKERGGFDDGLMLERTGLPSPLQYNEEAELPMEMRVELRERRRISSVDQLPRPSDNVHIDRRETAEGQKERQFTFTIPIYASDIVKPNISFSLPTSAGIEHEMTLVITLERLSGDFRCRIRVQNMSGQLDLPFKD
jgi:predicted house-cleaning noncanonical NTP pyrophosphatase (MazG superfamily)